MASPSDESDNASEPETPDEEEIIEAGFDPLLFWDQYRQFILLATGLILLGAVGFGVYEFNQAKRIEAAGAALAQASSEDDYRQIVDKYAGTVAAGDASLALGGKLRGEKKYDEAIEALQTFLDKYPTHPLAHAGDLSIAETLEAQGKTEEALAKYAEVAAKYPDSYSAPLAVIAQANLLRNEGKRDEARRLYENFKAQFPDSIFTQEAMSEMQLMRPAAGEAGGAEPQSVKDQVSSLLQQAVKAAGTAAGGTPAAEVPKGPAAAVPGASPR
jgi:tetratricopeptide (TPR) repeat protein